MTKSGFVAPQVLIFALAFAAVAGSYLAFKPEIKNEEIVPESAVNSVVEELENSDWQTYRNEEYGFEFKYLKSGYVLEPSDSRFIIRQDPPPIEFGARFILEVFPNSVIKTNLVDFAKGRQEPENLIGIEKINLNGTEWLWARSKDSYFEQEVSKQYYAINNGFVYRVFYSPLNNEDFSKVFSTFKFISPSESINTYDWQTYRNEEYGFEFNYPKDWWSPTFKTWKDLNEFSSEGKSCPSKNDIYAILNCLSYKDIQTETIGENKFYFVESIWNENGLENKVLYAYFMREDRVYSVVFQNLNNVEDLDKITKEIFSTFKFIK